MGGRDICALAQGMWTIWASGDQWLGAPVVDIELSSNRAPMRNALKSDPAALAWASRQLGTTGRGKHMAEFSYYHVDLIAEVPDVAALLETTRRRFGERQSSIRRLRSAWAESGLPLVRSTDVADQQE